MCKVQRDWDWEEEGLKERIIDALLPSALYRGE
jgi:hypothetical protein